MAHGTSVLQAVILFVLSILVITSAWQDDPDCGTQTAPLEPEINIIGGRDAQTGEWPWKAALLVNNQQVRCGVTIITTEWVVTAANCIGFIHYPEIYSVAAGLTDLRIGSTVQQSQVSEIYIHPNYTWSDNDWDIALLKMDPPFNITDYVRTICVPDMSLEDEFDPGTPVEAIGWGGVTETGYIYPILQEILVEVVSTQSCQDQYPDDDITDNMICAGLPGDGKDTCNFDGGGPLMARSFNTWYLAGVISSQYCGNTSGIFTRITAFESWLAPIFDGGVPETVGDCTRFQFTCPDGWCADYSTKCNGISGDGCAEGGDERLCAGYNEFFDPFLFTTQLDPNSITKSFAVNDNEDCSRLCLNDPDHSSPACLAFDVIADASELGYICNFAGDEFDTIPIPFNQSVMHFEIETFPTPDDLQSIIMPYGRFGTTRFIIDEEINGANMFWRFTPGTSGIDPGIVFRFAVIHAGNGGCQNEVIIRDGLSPTDRQVFKECLEDVPTSNEGVFVKGATGNLLEYQQGENGLGFVAEYIAVTYCDGDLATDGGSFTSPNYPSTYPEYSMCTTKVTAPSGSQILVHMEDFMLESGNGEDCDSDSLSVYDAADGEDDNNLIGVFCGEQFPDYIQSTGQNLVFVFRSDGFVQHTGFSASYEFVPEADNPVCGVRTVPLQPEINLIGGKTAQEGEWPWQTAILVNGVVRCGGVLIDPSWVLTAGYCIDSYIYPELFTVLAGLNNLAGSDNTQFLQVSEIYVHPNYTINEGGSNIALLKMTEPFVINDYVRTACVPGADMEFDAGTMCTVSGWGSIEDIEPPAPYQDLQEMVVSIVSQQECEEEHNHPVSGDIICAVAEGKDTCFFDLGGPLVTEVDDAYILVGLVASQFCWNGTIPATYTRVTSFEDWISPIFTGGNPERIAECTRDQYVCPGGWCAGYETKCNGVNDGCVYGGDENFCDESSQFYDPYLFNTRLTPESVVQEIGPANDLSTCANLCRGQNDYLCLAFDVEIVSDGYICYFASNTFDTMSIPLNRTFLHFEIENTPEPSSMITYTNGKIATPRFDPEYSGPGTDLYYWILQPELVGLEPGIIFRFPIVDGDSSNCENVTLRRGTEASDPVEYDACLDNVDMSAEGVFVPGMDGVRVEFDTTNWREYGFILKFESVSYCNGEFTDVPGYFTSPNYPQPYPANSMCSTLITAPEGTHVSVFFNDFQLEMDSSGECIDTLSVYDSNRADESRLVGVYCGSMLPPIFTGSGQNLFFVFRSDGALSYRGFNAAFQFGEDGSDCGKQKVPLGEPTINIIGGERAQEGEYPWQALLLSQQAARCGAALLTPSWVVTSAACMDTPNFPEINSVLMGLTDLTDGDNVQLMDVEDIFVHPDYQWWDNDWDIALLKLKTPFRITNYTRTICNPESDMTFNPGTNCTATGWGTTTGDERINQFLQEIQVGIISADECQTRIPGDNITENMICAYAQGKDPCSFDAGGPLVTQVEDTWYLAGVISSQFCAVDEKPGIYANVAAFADWLQPIYEGGDPETFECTPDEFQCPEGFCTDYSTKCNGVSDGCRYGGEETTCFGYLEFFDPFLFNVQLNESYVRDTEEVSDNAECAQLCLERTDFTCLAFDILSLYPGYSCVFAAEEFDTVKVPFSFANTHLQIEKFPLPFGENPEFLLSPSGRIATPRWIPSITTGTEFEWHLKSDLQDVNRGYIFHFSVVNSKDEDPRDCENEVTFRGGTSSGPVFQQICLNELPSTALFVPLASYEVIVVKFTTEDVNQYGFIAKYGEVTYCNGNLQGSPETNGTFTSPNYPHTYPAEAYCTTTLTAPEGYNVRIDFTDFQLESDYDMACANDFDTLTIYDGPEADESMRIGTYCGVTIADYFQSTGQVMTVVFKSDAFLEYKGFSADYQFVAVEECHNNFYLSQGSFTSPNYPDLYPADSSCPTRITTTPEMRVLLVFLDVELEYDGSPGCSNDFDTVKIYDSYKQDDGKLIGAVCGTDPPQTVFTSSGDSLLAYFQSDNDFHYRGFNAIFYTFPALSSCDNIFTIAPNTFNSPGYPDNYPNRVTCTTLIIAPTGSVVRLTFLDFAMEGPNFNGDCIWDSLTIYNSVNADPEELIGSYCGQEAPEPLLSTNTSMYIVFASDDDVNQRGFEAYYEFVSDDIGCDNIFSKGPGEVSSPLYPENYPNGITCRSLFIAPEGMIVRIEMHDFQLEDDFSNCAQEWDTLMVYDSDEEDKDALLGTFCGNSIPGYFESSSNRMYMVFDVDSSVSRRGFYGTYAFLDGPVIIPPPPPLADDQCGLQTAPMGPITNIVGGQPANEGEWPWQGILLIRDAGGDDDFRCGASLLTANWVITAAHCIDVLNDPLVFSVGMGTTSIIDISDYFQLRDVSEVYVHPDYEREGNDNDIALLRISTPFTVTDYVRPVCTAPANWEEYLDQDVVCTATGWGYTVDGGFASNILREVEVPIYDRDTCIENYAPEPITDNMICAGYAWGGRDSCLGDDGGPLVTQVDDQWALVGIISWGDGCAKENQPRVYTRVTAYEDWIDPIYTGGIPDGKTPECPFERFQCRDGWCIDYEKKCDGTMDCFYGDDEEFCEGDILYFDYVAGKQLQSNNIRDSFTVDSVEECSTRCITDYVDNPCLTFDVGPVPGHLMCYIGEDILGTQPNTGSIDHFEIETMPCPGDILQTVNGRFATPKWLPFCRNPAAAEAGEFYWVMMPPASDDYNRVMIEFGTVHNPPPNDCSTPDSVNTVIVKAGPDVNSPIVGQYCLNDLPESVWVPVPMARVEFYTVDSDTHGFLANFNAFWSCDNTYTTSPGVFTTPNYPDNYPNGISCNTLLRAPEDMQVFMFMRDFSLEPQDESCRFDWDIMRVYDRNVPDDAYLIGKYCGTSVPYYFRSTGRDLYVNFQSDISINAPGFEAAFYFVPANSTLPPPGNTTAECGLQTLPMEPEDQIVGGKPAQRGEWPWQIALYYYKTFICGGVLLTPEWVVTTASCAPDDNPINYDIIAGSNNVNGETDYAQRFQVSEAVIHPQFDFAGSRYDIALLRLDRNATINDFVRTVCMPSEQDQSDFPPDTLCMATGWGSTYNGGPGTDELFEVAVSIIDQDFCRAQYAPDPIQDEMLCAGNLDGGQGVCRGDAGGPLVSQVENRWYLVGLPSWSRGCAEEGYPAVYTSISFFEDWINNIIEGNYTKELMCNANFTDAPGSFTSPFYPANYPNDVMCITRITAPEGFNVYMTVRDFLLEDDGTVDCSSPFDSLRVYDSDHGDEEQLIGVYCSANIPRTFRSTGRSLYTVFETDGSVTERGYDMGFYFVEETGCSNEFTRAPGAFSSPNYPENYPNNAECRNLITAPPKQKVFLVIQDFRLESDGQYCVNDFDTLSIYDSDTDDNSKLIGTYCGEDIPETFTSTAENLYVVFKTDATTTYKGYRASFYFLPEMTTTVPPTGPQPKCGQQTVELDPETRLIGGNPAQEGEYPWHGALLLGGVYSCGIALLTPNWAVTAAHCVLEEANNYELRFGTNNLVEFSEQMQQREVSDIFINPDYMEDTGYSDVALLKFTRSLPITNYIRTICAPPMNMEPNFGIGAACYVTGWGSSQEEGGTGPNEEFLNELPQSIVNTNHCFNEFFPEPTEDHICAGETGTGTCTGDDGGPLISKVDDTWYLVGVATRTSLCANSASLYMRMTSFYGWLSPIFNGEDPERRELDPLEPIREELGKVQDEANMYMYFMYTFVAVLVVLMLSIVYTMYYCSSEREQIKARLNQQGYRDGVPLTPL